MKQEPTQDDLTYLRRVAEAGQRSPLLGGEFALWWGTLSALTMFGHWLVITQTLPLPERSLGMLWFGFILIGSAGNFWLGRRFDGKPGAGSTTNRTASIVWSNGAVALMALYLGLLSAVLSGQLESRQFNVMLPAALLVYSIGWMTSARLTADRLLYLPALTALIGVVAAGALVMTHWVYLATAVVLLVSTVLPGVWLQRRERAARTA